MQLNMQCRWCDMVTILLIVLLVVLLFGGGYGYRTGLVTYGNPLSIILVVVLVLLVLGLFGGPRYGWW